MIPQASAAPQRAGVTILIIDDDPEILETTALTVRSAGYSTIVGASAAEALSLAAEHRPTLVLLDVCLPDGDGVDVARRLKEDPSLEGIFIILLSGQRTTAEDQAVGLNLGLADGYMARPLARKEFLARIEAFLRIHETQRQLRITMRELERSNEDLERFAFVASHDLQAPLRMMSMYSQLLKDRYAGQLDSDADDFIAFIVDGASRMSQLLEDLLAYSRVTAELAPAHPVPATRTAEQALANLGAQVAEAGAEVTIDELPIVLAEEIRLMRVFQNLMSNAMKFVRPGETPRIHVSAQPAGSMWRFSVSDNGIGIDPDHFTQVFEVFRRLNAQSSYPGTGIGLAECMRVIEHFGGTIWVESSGSSGTTFCFTLPAA